LKIFGALLRIGAWIYMDFGMSIRMDEGELRGMKI
jgi:hypothetical protein